MAQWGRREPLVVMCALTIGLLAACTEDHRPSGQPTASTPTPSLSGASESTARSPQAIIVHPSRGAIDVSESTARRIESADITSWSALGEHGQPVHFARQSNSDARVTTVAQDPQSIAVVPAWSVDPRVRVVTIDGANPLAGGTDYPLLGDGPIGADPVTITIVGDIMLARGVAAAMGDNLFAPLKPTAKQLAAADLTIGNLESSLSQQGAPLQGTDSFGADPAVLDGPERAGFDILSLANNHVGDYGADALAQTIQRLDASRIKRVGAGGTRRKATRPTIVDVGDTTIGVVAFNAIGESPAAAEGSPGVVQLRMPPRTGPLNNGDLNALLRQVRRLKQHVDAVLVLPHWGEQYTSRPIPVQRRVAKQLADAGASAVIGGHPHWVQGMEMFDDTVVAYSLGNFIFDMDFSKPTMQGIAIELTLWDGQVMSATPVPVMIDSVFSAHFVGQRRGAGILRDVWSNSYGSLGK
jgi:poly-gamma-glutamate synthesis protein (capsule biosynthesis protein)